MRVIVFPHSVGPNKTTIGTFGSAIVTTMLLGSLYSVWLRPVSEVSVIVDSSETIGAAVTVGSPSEIPPKSNFFGSPAKFRVKTHK